MRHELHLSCRRLIHPVHCAAHSHSGAAGRKYCDFLGGTPCKISGSREVCFGWLPVALMHLVPGLEEMGRPTELSCRE